MLVRKRIIGYMIIGHPMNWRNTINVPAITVMKLEATNTVFVSYLLIDINNTTNIAVRIKAPNNPFTRLFVAIVMSTIVVAFVTFDRLNDIIDPS